MTDFKRLTDTVWASPQITYAEVAAAAEQGFGLIINNRPDGESPDQTEGAAIEKAARDRGLDYVAIPVDHSGFSEQQVDAMAQALERTDGKILAYCRSGTRSTFLWALSEARRGKNADDLIDAASGAGYDIGGIAPTLEMLAAKARS